ncbi:PP2C-like domain-containing protein CG9801 [Amphibalanus amphitrite]|uniref:PP2C-like domain-containing protein CG9801 n=1 Tax=Amphibalanus amphitrite TaxID=1232801 RepID=UPI001C8FDC00|nr:PP2C-like domain-containing protein CG9801 [Amphibalanus amphitrite]
MPSNIKKRFAGFLRQLSSNSHCAAADQSVADLRGSTDGCFITKYLNGELSRSEVAIDHARDAAQLPEQRIGPLQPTVVAAYTGPAGGLTAVPHRAQPVTSSEPGINYIDSDDESEEEPAPADGTSLAARLARLHYPRQRLAGNLTLPTWVPRSPPVPYERWYRIRQGDLARCKAQTLPARRCFSDHRLDEEEELLQTMMTSLCSTNSDSLPNLGGPPAAGRAAASLDDLGPSSLEEFGPVSVEAATPTAATPVSAPGSPGGEDGRTVNGEDAARERSSPTGRSSDECPTPTNATEELKSSPDRELKDSSQPNGLPVADEDGGVAGEGSVSQLDGGLGSSCSQIPTSELGSPARSASFISFERGSEVDSGCVTGDRSAIDPVQTGSGEVSTGRVGEEGRDTAAPGAPTETAEQPADSGTAQGGDTAPKGDLPSSGSSAGRPVPERTAFCPSGSPAAPAATSTPIHSAGGPAAVSTPPRDRRGEPDGRSSDSESGPDRPAAEPCGAHLLGYQRYTRPDECLRRTQHDEIAGTVNWNRPHPRAFGSSVSLYECHPVTGVHAGEPIADAFGVVCRSNSALLALADGVNWGEKARLAARCAVHGCLDYLNRALFGAAASVQSTQDVFAALLQSFHAAHSLILQEGGMLTTLTAAAVVPCQLAQGRTRAKFVVCVCNVGDSLAYVFSSRHGVREITKGSHDINSMRDMRDALGALGPVAGQNPELNNLTLSMTQVEPGDIIFLTSDGVSDNFDPVVGKFVLPKKADEPSGGPQPPAPGSGRRRGSAEGAAARQADGRPARPAGNGTARGESGRGGKQPRPGSKTVLTPVPKGRSAKQIAAGPVPRVPPPAVVPTLPVVTALQRHELTQLRMDDLLRNGALEGEGRVTDARHLCCQLLDFAFRLTTAKRRVLEDPELYTGGDGVELSRAEQRARRRRVCEKLAVVPGKLDHASVVAYQVGEEAAPRAKAETAI